MSSNKYDHYWPAFFTPIQSVSQLCYFMGSVMPSANLSATQGLFKMAECCLLEDLKWGRVGTAPLALVFFIVGSAFAVLESVISLIAFATSLFVTAINALFDTPLLRGVATNLSDFAKNGFRKPCELLTGVFSNADVLPVTSFGSTVDINSFHPG